MTPDPEAAEIARKLTPTMQKHLIGDLLKCPWPTFYELYERRLVAPFPSRRTDLGRRVAAVLSEPSSCRDAERIVAAAVCLEGGLVLSRPAPERHGDIIRMIDETVGKGPFIGPDDQGFLTSAGRFVGRLEAVGIAIAAGQIEAPKWPPDLYSEDLW